MGLRELKAELKQLDNDALINHIAELYKKYKPVKEYFDFFINPNEKEIIEQEKAKELNSIILDSLKKLPSKQKEAIFLRFNESLEYNEIASILNITIESARKQVYRAIKTLRKLVKKQILVQYQTLQCRLRKTPQ